MKRLVYLLIAVSLMLALVPAAVSADTEEDPMEVDLLAGQTMDVGDVKVWNDGDYLYVKYETTGWCLTETHLHVAMSLEGIPQTKKGNPIPGQFEYSTEHKPCVSSYTYQIPLSWDPDTELYIAAHAAAGEVKTATIFSNAGDNVYGPLGFNPGLTGDWGEAKSAVVAINPLGCPWCWGDDTIPGAKWISTAASTEEPCVDSWRKFTETFDVPGSPLSASLMVNADNEFWAYLNGEFVGTDNQIFDGGTSITGVETYDSIIPLEGSNALEFIVKNWAQCSGNPNGLVYKAVVEYLYGAETAWGAGLDFLGKNWATYFTYTVQSAGPTVTPGAPTWTKAAGVRYKGWNTGKEIFLGPMLPPSALPRVEAEYNEFGSVGQKTYQITFAFDQGQNAISTSISSPDANLTFDFDVSGAPGCPSADWDAMEIVVRDSRTDSGAALQNLVLGSFDLGDFGTVNKAGTPGWQNWTVTGFDFSQSFLVNADLVVDGYNGNESIKVEFNVGCLTP